MSELFFEPDTVVCRRYQQRAYPGRWFYHYDKEPVWNSEPVTLGQLLAMVPHMVREQADPAVTQVRFRRPEKGMPDWSVWQDLPVDRFDPERTKYIDSQGYEVETRALYTRP